MGIVSDVELKELKESVPEPYRPESPAAADALPVKFEGARGKKWTPDTPSVVLPRAEARAAPADAAPAPGADDAAPDTERTASAAPAAVEKDAPEAKRAPSSPAPAAPRADDNSAVEAVHAAARLNDLTVHQRGVKAAEEGMTGVALGGGERASGSAQAAMHGNAAEIQAKKKDEKDRDWLLKQLAARIRELEEEIVEWQAQITENEAEIAQIDTEVQELTTLRQLIEDDELDPANPAHARLLAQSGIDPEASKDEQLEAIDDELADRNARRDALESENDALRDRIGENQRRIEDINEGLAEIDALEASGTLGAAEADAQREALLAQDEQARRERTEASRELRALQAEQESGSTPEHDALAERNAAVQDTLEEELSRFSRELALAREIEDPMQRLARERELVSGLSDDAALQASVDPETEGLFTEGHFDALEEAPAADETRGRAPVAGPAP